MLGENCALARADSFPVDKENQSRRAAAAPKAAAGKAAQSAGAAFPAVQRHPVTQQSLAAAATPIPGDTAGQVKAAAAAGEIMLAGRRPTAAAARTAATASLPAVSNAEMADAAPAAAAGPGSTRKRGRAAAAAVATPAAAGAAAGAGAGMPGRITRRQSSSAAGPPTATAPAAAAACTAAGSKAQGRGRSLNAQQQQQQEDEAAADAAEAAQPKRRRVQQQQQLAAGAAAEAAAAAGPAGQPPQQARPGRRGRPAAGNSRAAAASKRGHASAKALNVPAAAAGRAAVPEPAAGSVPLAPQQQQQQQQRSDAVEAAAGGGQAGQEQQPARLGRRGAAAAAAAAAGTMGGSKAPLASQGAAAAAAEEPAGAAAGVAPVAAKLAGGGSGAVAAAAAGAKRGGRQTAAAVASSGGQVAAARPRRGCTQQQQAEQAEAGAAAAAGAPAADPAAATAAPSGRGRPAGSSKAAAAAAADTAATAPAGTSSGPGTNQAPSGRGRTPAAAAAPPARANSKKSSSSSSSSAAAGLLSDPAPVAVIDDDPTKWGAACDFPAAGCLPVRDERLEAAAAAAGLPRLAPGAGLLRQEAAGGLFSRKVECGQYVLGQPTGHHAKLYRVQKVGGKVQLQQLSTSCHDCQHQHVRWDCPTHTGRGFRASYCNRCLHHRYRHSAFSVSDLHTRCPLCRGLCTCKKCLRQPDHEGRLATGQFLQDGPAMAAAGRYVLRCTGGHVADWLAAQDAEACAAGFSELAAVPVEAMLEKERLNCDRCGTNLVGLAANCGSCGWDLCTSCMKELRQQQQQHTCGAAAAAAAAAAGNAGKFEWTCCNPNCTGRQQPAAAVDSAAAAANQQQQQDAGTSAAAAAAAAAGEAPGSARSGKRQRRLSQKMIDSQASEAAADQALREAEQQEEDAGRAAEGVAAAEVPAAGCGMHSVHGQALTCRPGAALLSVRLLLPHDLAGREGAAGQQGAAAVLHQLREVAQAHAETGQQPLQLSDCPLLALAGTPTLQQQLQQRLPHLSCPDGSPLTLELLMGEGWWRVLPAAVRDSWRRKASSSTWLFTPAASDLDPAAAAAAAGEATAADGGLPAADRLLWGMLVWWAHWLVGDPIIVRQLKGRIPWDPDTMRRAVADGKGGLDERLVVLNCADFHVDPGIKPAAFFTGYTKGLWPGKAGVCGSAGAAGGGAAPLMLKVKDWPPSQDFRGELPRHMMDFVERLPLRAYTDPRLGRGPLNLASMLLPADNPTDLGPKGYLAYGRWREAAGEGDSVTKLHLDMTDAINILMDQQPRGDAVARQAAAGGVSAAAGGSACACGGSGLAAAASAVVVRCGDSEPDQEHGYGGAGAVWDIARRGDVPALKRYLVSNAGDFCHQGKAVEPAACSSVALSPVQSQVFMLGERHRAVLCGGGVELLHFEQHLEEGVLIPGGCPHQVRNLASCCKIAVDFVSPESVTSCLEQHQQLRALDLALGEPTLQGEDVPLPSARDHAEKLQSQLILLRSALAAHGSALAPVQVLLQPPEPELPVAAAGGRLYTAMHRQAQRPRQQQQQPRMMKAQGKAKRAAADDVRDEEGQQRQARSGKQQQQPKRARGSSSSKVAAGKAVQPPPADEGQQQQQQQREEEGGAAGGPRGNSMPAAGKRSRGRPCQQQQQQPMMDGQPARGGKQGRGARGGRRAAGGI